ncbi:MAG: gliding motility-associated C-terminal domain-containing protein [Bacteroidales bacterium]|nr:gliding motility-associated C-terminal domain-containing protein [Bacteroidales bacterium]MBN2763106.1 gliding motility-associated C-terminal domain-containing protein [Bacteroidales bacterium]
MKPLYLLYYIISFWFLTGFCCGTAFGQQPEKPRLTMVTVDTETGNDIVYWEQSPSVVDYYIIGMAVRPNPQEPYALIQVGTAPSSATSFENPNTNSDEVSIGYTVWAVVQQSPDSLFFSLYDEPDSTVFLQADFDSCRATISLVWNDYNNWRGEIMHYTVYQRLGNGLYVVLATLPEGVNNYTLSDVEENTTYGLFVEVAHNDNIRRSTSNRIDLFTDMSIIPDTINADYATLGPNNTVDLSFTIAPGSELQTYKLLRSVTPDGAFDTVVTLHTAEKTIQYQDEVSFTSGVYYYKLIAFNNCGKPVVTSNLASNILLGGDHQNQQISLSWNEYIDWYGGVDHYQVTRETGVNGTLLDSVSVGTEPFFRDDFSNRIDFNDPQSTRVCYQIRAYESSAADGSQNTSLSNRICFSLDPDVHMPNAFIPNSIDAVNNTFRPIFSFYPERYEMTIFNRSGLKIWEGTEPWDGRVNGKQVTEGVYLYHLKIFNFSDTARELTGSVTVVCQ